MFALLLNNQLDLLDPCECHIVVLWLYLPYKHNWSNSMLLIYSTYSKPFRRMQKTLIFHWWEFFPHQSERSEKNMYWQQSKHRGWKTSQKTVILNCFWRKQQKQNRNGNDHGNDSLTHLSCNLHMKTVKATRAMTRDLTIVQPLPEASELCEGTF